MMLFRLLNVSANFQDYINKISVEKHNVSIIVYLDNILIYTKNKSQRYVNVIW